jgi:hypothetical protein
MKWETKKNVFTLPNLKTLHQKYQYLVKNGLYNVGALSIKIQKHYGYDFFWNWKSCSQLWETPFRLLTILKIKKSKKERFSFIKK